MNRLPSWRLLATLFIPLAALALVAWGLPECSACLLASIAAGILSLQEDKRP